MAGKSAASGLTQPARGAGLEAAGHWINGLTPGSAKNAAIASYAGKLSFAEPEAAAEWAVALPPGELRESTLCDVYRAWVRAKPEAKAAADAFAEQHGLQL